MDQNEESFFWQNQFQMGLKIEIIYKEIKSFCGSDNHNTYAGFTKIKKVFFLIIIVCMVFLTKIETAYVAG